MMSIGKMCGVHKLCWVLVIVGALNWGLIGAFEFNLVHTIFGAWAVVERIVYLLVGISAICMLGSEQCCMGKEKKV